MFDGSSVAGWKGINESDMILMPDPSTAVLDPFFDDTTLILRCDIIEPSNMQGYERDPRSIARRAESYMQSTGIADAAYFGPENEFFVFDDVKWNSDMGSCGYSIDSEEAGWNSQKAYEDGNIGHRPGVKAVTSQYLLLILYKTCVQQCVWYWKKWVKPQKYITMK